MKKLILVPDLIPTTSWYKNLRNKDPKAWEGIRKASYAKAGNICEICGEKGSLHCHENWEYDEDTGIQKLVSLISLCPKCHDVKHIGFAEISGRWDVTLAHMMKINKINKEEAIKIIRESFGVWKERSKIQWELDLSILEKENEQKQST